MKTILLHFKKLDWTLIIIFLLLVGFGLLSIYSSSLGRGDFLNFQKQLIFFGIGFFIMIFFSFFDWRILRDTPFLILILYLFSLLSLFLLFFFAPEIRGIKAWYKLGQISIDPIEPTKIILIILLAKYFSMRHVEMYRIQHILLSGLYVLIPSILVFYQPDLGSILILIALWVGILIISGIKLRHFLILVLAGLLIFIISWQIFLKDYQKQRIIGFFQPQLEPLGVNWSQNQSKIAIGSGGIFGQGFSKGAQTQYGFLPETQTDFIFAAIAEEFGLIGVIILFVLYSLLVYRIVKFALLAPNNFIRLFASGFAFILISQIFINVGMNIGILPIIGNPLPLVSYGGSSLIMTFLAIGILQSFKTH
jgi:rod shape determining protein RodA